MSILKEQCKEFLIFISPLIGGVCLFLGLFFVVGLIVAVMVISLALQIDNYRCFGKSKKWLVHKAFFNGHLITKTITTAILKKNLEFLSVVY